nr:uncharacterized protein LOC110130498 isoform X2 [Odocoileus virginianus texanus]
MSGPEKKLQAHVLPQLAMSSHDQCFERRDETSLLGRKPSPTLLILFLHVRLITANPEILSGSECALEPRPVHCLQSAASRSSSPFISAGSPWISLACPPQQYPALDSSGPSCLQLQHVHHDSVGAVKPDSTRTSPRPLGTAATTRPARNPWHWEGLLRSFPVLLEASYYGSSSSEEFSKAFIFPSFV